MEQLKERNGDCNVILKMERGVWEAYKSAVKKRQLRLRDFTNSLVCEFLKDWTNEQKKEG